MIIQNSEWSSCSALQAVEEVSRVQKNSDPEASEARSLLQTKQFDISIMQLPSALPLLPLYLGPGHGKSSHSGRWGCMQCCSQLQIQILRYWYCDTDTGLDSWTFGYSLIVADCWLALPTAFLPSVTGWEWKWRPQATSASTKSLAAEAMLLPNQTIRQYKVYNIINKNQIIKCFNYIYYYYFIFI
jgi:hypothetical protein